MNAADGPVLTIRCVTCLRHFNRTQAKLIVGSPITVCADCAFQLNRYSLQVALIPVVDMSSVQVTKCPFQPVGYVSEIEEHVARYRDRFSVPVDKQSWIVKH